MTAKEFAEKNRGKMIGIKGTSWVGKLVGYAWEQIILDVLDPDWMPMNTYGRSVAVMFEQDSGHAGLVDHHYCVVKEDQPITTIKTIKSARCPKCGAFDFYADFSEVSCSNPHCRPTLR
jgi:hypothetical protein